VISSLSCFVLLFVVQNVFQQEVYRPHRFTLSPAALVRLEGSGLPVEDLRDLQSREFSSAVEMRRAVRQRVDLGRERESQLLRVAEVEPIYIDPLRFDAIDRDLLTPGQIEAVRELEHLSFQHAWELETALCILTDEWCRQEIEAAEQERERGLEELVEVFGGSD
jgi:PiT family inorganic phosphate transporter